MRKKDFAKRQVNRAFRAKVIKEKAFARQLKGYFAKQKKLLKKDQELTSIEPELDRHYERVVRGLINSKEKKKKELIDRIDLLFDKKAQKRSIRIDQTTKKYHKRSIVLAKNELLKEGVLNPSNAIVMGVASRIFGNYSKGRIGNIAMSENQMATEGARLEITKQAHKELETAIIDEDKELAKELYVLSSSYTSYVVKDNIGKIETAILITMVMNAKKQWRTMGDERVRTSPFDHVSANGQEVFVEEVFMVSGEELMNPGDSSRGASAGNTSRCRCTVGYL